MSSRTEFAIELEHLINKHSMEGGSNTPDFVLARYLMGCLDAFDLAITDRNRFSKPTVPPTEAKQDEEFYEDLFKEDAPQAGEIVREMSSSMLVEIAYYMLANDAWSYYKQTGVYPNAAGRSDVFDDFCRQLEQSSIDNLWKFYRNEQELYLKNEKEASSGADSSDHKSFGIIACHAGDHSISFVNMYLKKKAAEKAKGTEKEPVK